jgi:Bardet-Biedl syndrome 1 protein
VALVTYHISDTAKTPIIAVASGSVVFLHRDLRPFVKFTIPPIPIDQAEAEVWQELKADKITAQVAQEKLNAIKEEGAKLSIRSLDFLMIEDPQQLTNFANTNKVHPPFQQVK